VIIAIIAVSGIEAKHVVKLDLHLNVLHCYGPCSIQMRHSYTTTAQVVVRTSSLRFNINVYVLFQSCNHLAVIENAINRRYSGIFRKL